MIIAIILALALWQQPAQTDSLSLRQCYELARVNHPAREQLTLDKQSTQLRQESISHKNYPQVSMSGSATYQNEVTTVPNAPFSISKDQYKLNLQVDQNLFDGGAAREGHKVTAAKEHLNDAQVNVQLYGVHNEVNQAFFSVLLARTSQHVLDLKKQVLEKRLAMVRSQVKNGMVLPGTEAALQAELLTTDQQITSVKADQEAAINTLTEVIGQKIDTTTKLSLPFDTTSFVPGNQIDRPELNLFAANQTVLDREMDQTKVMNIPKLSAFAQGMYGRPGLNIFKDKFETNYMIGVRLTWKIWDWQEAKRQKSLLSVQKKMVNTQQNTFLRGVHIGMQRDMANITKYHKLMTQDRRIIELRKQVESQSASQLRNGTITPSNYLEVLNQVYQAQLSREQHRLQWIYAIVQYKTQTGTL